MRLPPGGRTDRNDLDAVLDLRGETRRAPGAALNPARAATALNKLNKLLGSVGLLSLREPRDVAFIEAYLAPRARPLDGKSFLEQARGSAYAEGVSRLASPR